MKASELIKELQRQIDKYGDLPVTHEDSWGEGEVYSTSVYTESGNTPDLRKKKTDPPATIYLF